MEHVQDDVKRWRQLAVIKFTIYHIIFSFFNPYENWHVAIIMVVSIIR